MKTFLDWVVCKHCDSVHQRRPLPRGARARCAHCSAPLYQGHWLDVDAWLALSIAAGIAFLICNLCPLLALRVQGQQVSVGVWQAAMALLHRSSSPLAVPFALSIIIVPMLQIGLLIWLLWHARRQRPAPGHALALRWLSRLRPWCMVEVFLLGNLVAIIKLGALLSLSVGPGLWAMGALMLLLCMITQHTLHDLWRLHGRIASAEPQA
ncbi:paraquat-inducible protein A [Uliginosibacterium sediminicola]|uniref:Paraquat-inducible protein A n=1 Tax=Uliginosibacterium sediminicola TaxID=2024550 RepID=A0ABU9Z2E3_9RHOO